MRFRKVLPLPIAFLLLLGAWAFQGGEVRVEHQTPDKITPGMRKEVDIRIHKGERGGFAKLELEVPEGFKVEAVEKSGASFTFKDGTAKFIWMAMPKGGQFLVKYSLKAKKGMKEGKRTIKGKFRYLENNKRKKVDVPDKVIEVDRGTEIAQKEEKGDEKKKGGKAPADSSLGVDVERSVERSKGRSFMVRTKLKKGELRGFGKLMDTVPTGFEAVAVKDKGASFTFENGKAKFVWMSMPKASTLKLSYRLRPTSAKPGTYRLSGAFAFIEEGETVTVQLDSSVLELEKGKKLNAGKSEKDTGKAGEKKEDVASAGKSGEKDSLTSVPAPQKGIDFRVQICAGHEQVKEGHFEKVYGYEGDYDIDHHEGWLKYLTGNFDAYKEARDKRVHFRKNYELPGPFVTAYNDGERITVQEALMVTDQDWVQ